MKNTITVTIPFSFKGVEYTPSSVIDLDDYVTKSTDFSTIFHHVATENSIGNYSYEYEVLETSVHIFSQPTGIAKDFHETHDFDLTGFKEKLDEIRIIESVAAIARETLQVKNIEDNKPLKKALLAAYQAGKKSNK